MVPKSILTQNSRLMQPLFTQVKISALKQHKYKNQLHDYITYLGYIALSVVQAYYVRAGGFGNTGCEFFIRRLKYSIDFHLKSE